MSISKDLLVPVAGLSKQIGYCLSTLEDSRARTVKVIEDLTEEELSQKYLPNLHQIGALVLHLGECEFWWIQTVWAGKELSEEDRKFSHFEDTTETDFALKGYMATDCITFLDNVHARSIETLSGFSDDDLDTTVPFERHNPRFESSLRWILHHLTDHEANHRGQNSMMKRLMREPSL
jgi:uncharacterized damage-inducible protein DinB